MTMAVHVNKINAVWEIFYVNNLMEVVSAL